MSSTARRHPTPSRGLAVVLLAAAVAMTGANCGGGGGGGGSSARSSTGAGAPRHGALELLTYNVAGLPVPLSGSQPDIYMPLISPLLNAYAVVVVQEDFWYHAQLEASAWHPYRTPPVPPPSPLMNDGLNAFSIYPFTGLERHAWVQCNGVWDQGSDCMAMKGFMRLRLEVAPGVEIDVYDLHADAGGGPLDVQARVDQYAQLRDHILANAAGHAVVVAGDYNLHGFDPEDEPILQSFMVATGLQEACRALACGDERIDRVLFRDGDTVMLSPTVWRVPTEFVTSTGADLSDHKPVFVRLDWVAR